MDFQIFKTPQSMKSLPTRGLKSATSIWKTQKQQRDSFLSHSSSGNWIVENKQYDLTQFISKHPGGPSWLTLTKGHDITEHFVAHHLNQQKARQILKKYYVKDCDKKISRFTFEEDGFYRTLKKRLLAKYTVQQIQNESFSKLYAIIIFVLWLICLALASHYNSYLFCLPYAPLTIGILGISHNFAHHKQSFYRYFGYLSGIPHTEWQIMHCISHHIYTNSELDFQAAQFEPMAYYLRNMPKNKWYYQFLLQIVYLFLQPINISLKLFIIPIVKKKAPDFSFAFPLLILLYFLLQNSFTDSLKLFLVFSCTSSFLTMKVLFCGHKVQDTWTAGSEIIQDFGQQMVYSTNDTDIWITGIWSYILLAGFNIHIAHHLFPTADHHILPQIDRIVSQLCKQKGIKKKQKTRIQCFVSMIKGFLYRIPFSKK